MSLEKLQPANPREVNVYAPYYQGRKRSALPLAITLYQVGSLEGIRKIEGGESIPFVASWNVSSLPADLTRCRLQFDGNAELSYEVMLANFEFVDFLIEVLFYFKANRVADFSQGFYRKLLRLDD
ncbi:type IV pilus biogenesis protein EbsA [Egbenema bharatensis]|uniref:type IV pilus biogenesis protein EbsA n=1 Tax=Egbenema bharatensis TaxID=3463334 RepID=UPI003A8516DA